jgi:uncharacterized protein (TIGR00725 family)
LSAEQRTRYIGVIGAAEPSAEQEALAERLGAELARGGAVVVCGGLGGVMEAVSRGVHGAGGVVVGLLPGGSRADGNAFLTVALTTGLGELRNGLIVRASDALIAVGGGWGTLSEIALALRQGRPVFGLDSWTPTRAGLAGGVVAVADPAQAAAAALQAAAAT